MDLESYGEAVTLYDYSKNHERKLPENYHVTLSASEKTSLSDIQALLSQGFNVAMAFDCSKPALKKALANGATFQGFPVLNGDDHDERYLDPKGTVVALSRKLPIGGKKDDHERSFFFPLSILELENKGVA